MADPSALFPEDPGFTYGSILPLKRGLDAQGQATGPIAPAWPGMVHDQVNALWDLLTTPGNVARGREVPDAGTSARITGDLLQDLPMGRAGPENELGVFVRGWHGTSAEFGDEYLAGQGIGPHFGNLEQAHSRIGAGWTTTPGESPIEQLSWVGRGVNVRPANIDINNPIRLNDMDSSGSWRSMSPWEHPEYLARQLQEKGLMTEAESRMIGGQMKSLYEHSGDSTDAWQDYLGEKQKWLSFIRQRLIDRGHDAIVYHNTFEGAGDSVVPLFYDKGQITPGFGKSHALELQPHTFDLDRKINQVRYRLEPVDHDPFAEAGP